MALRGVGIGTEKNQFCAVVTDDNRVAGQVDVALDAICARYYGRTEGVVETVLQANPGLSELGVILPHGTEIDLPDVPSSPVTNTINLWE